MLDHTHRDRWQVDHLPAQHTDLVGGLEPVSAPATGPGLVSDDLVLDHLVRCRDLLEPRARVSTLPGLRPLRRRCERGACFANPSELGGFDEFRES